MRNTNRAIQHLRSSDRRLRAVIDRVGAFDLELHRCSRFESLVRAIVYQQLSGKAAATILGRLAAACGGVLAPASIERLGDGELRAAGISAQKISYLRDLAARSRSGALALEAIEDLDDAAIVEALTQVKGIGRWSAEIFLIFVLGRPDVFPANDLGLRKAAQKIYRLRELPEPDKLLKIAGRWKPYRTFASWYLWRSLDGEAKIGDA